MSNKIPHKSIHTYVKSFIAMSPEELETSINTFLLGRSFIVCDVDYMQTLTGEFGAYVTYKVIEE